MGPAMVLFVLGALSIASCQADINVTEYVYWRKEDINQWDRFFPRRYLEEERLTNAAASEAIDNFAYNLRDSLQRILAFPFSELKTAKELMAGTNAQGCVNGISTFLDKNIQEQFDAYQDCTAEADSKLYRLKNSWVRVNTSYQAAYQRALAGIDACYKTYPNKDSIDRLRSCVESMNTNYFTIANNTQRTFYPSPSMSYFQNTVVKCANSAVQAVVAKGYQFLKMLVSCAALSDTVDPTEYALDLSTWKGYNDTLADQILQSQNDIYNQIVSVEKTIIFYYNMQKQALEQYVVESRGLEFYLRKVYSYVNDYYNTITATALDNPGDSACVSDARSVLDSVSSTGATTSLSCDQKIVSDTNFLLATIHEQFSNINNKLPYIGNVAVLNCVSQGYVYAPSTVRQCFLLTSAEFSIDYTESYQSVTNYVQKISNYISSFYVTSDLPCDNTVLQRLFLGADKALFKLKRCLYTSSGTTYDVTTPTATSTTPAAS